MKIFKIYANVDSYSIFFLNINLNKILMDIMIDIESITLIKTLRCISTISAQSIKIIWYVSSIRKTEAAAMPRMQS